MNSVAVDLLTRRAYVRGVVARVTELRSRGIQDCGGVADHDLPAYYEQVTGKRFESREVTAQLPAYPGMQDLLSALRGGTVHESARARKRARGIAARCGADLACRQRVASWTGAPAEKARAMGNRWLCPHCGPVDQPLHGDDEVFHCPEFGCDEVVDAVLPEQAVGWGWKEQNARAFERKKKEGAMAHVKDPRPCGTCGENFTPPPGPGYHRNCEPCKEARKNPVRACSRCGENFSPKGPGYHRLCAGCKGKPKKAAPPKAKPATPTPPKANPAPPPLRPVAPKPAPPRHSVEGLCLLTEAQAFVRVAEAIDGMSPDQVRRVVGWFLGALPASGSDA